MCVALLLSALRVFVCCVIAAAAAVVVVVVFFNDTATTEIYTRSLVGSVRCV